MASTVGTSTTDHAVRDGYMRKGFYAEGLFWAFYSDGTNAGWEFSADGITWTGVFTNIGACVEGSHFSVWFDGIFVHYVRFDNHDLFYRRGTPVNDGTITWDPAGEQTVYDGSIGDEYTFPCIAVDSNGYAWIGALRTFGGNDTPYVLKNANNDGTWADDAGFPHELSAVDDSSWSVCPVPLTSGRAYVIYCRDSNPPLGILYDAGWDVEESDLADYSIESGYNFSAVAYGDNVHFVYNRYITNQIRHNERVWGVGWNAADVLVQDAVTEECTPALSIDPSTGDLYCFWTDYNTSHVYYKKYSGGSWDVGATDWIDESTDGIKFDWLISSFYMDYGGYVGLLYVTKTASPYNVRFAFLTMAPPVGWTGTISGVTNPSHIMGVAVANIAKVKGVS